MGESAIFDVPQASLIHGNELLFELVPGYEWRPTRKYSVPQHTLELVMAAVGGNDLELPLGWTPPQGITSAPETFVGYLMLDAWIGNTDRHHENWAVG